LASILSRRKSLALRHLIALASVFGFGVVGYFAFRQDKASKIQGAPVDYRA
jgi:hypothetical protein